MSHLLETTLRSDTILAAQEDATIRRAEALYRRGFTPKRISRSQMAALEERLLAAPDLESALGTVEGWLTRQLDKLRARFDRTGNRRSWLSPPGGDSSADSLGEELLAYLREERYLGESQEPGLQEDLDRLAALRRFWNRFHALFRYEAALERPMKLHDPSTDSEARS